MPARSWHPYLLREASESGSTTMDPQQLVNTIAVIQAQLANLTQTAIQTRDRLGRVETHLENRNEHDGEHNWMVQYQGRDERDPDSQFLKSIKIDVPTFDGRHDPQLFLDWTQLLDKYFTWYDLTDPRKVKFTVMKLISQAS